MVGVANGSSGDRFFRGRSCGQRGQDCRFEGRPSGQDRVLQNLPWVVRARLSRIYFDAATRGQQTEYFENQLRAFVERRRENRYMYNVSRSLSAATRSALAAHFRDLTPRPLGGAPRERAAIGRRIYEDGVPEANVPACMACHGPDARGQEAIPRLAGQLHEYISSQLVNWGKERGQDPASAVMLPTSHNLTRSQIAAVAAYVSYLQ